MSKPKEPQPVVTMDRDGEMSLDGKHIGDVERDERGHFVFLAVDLYPAELRAIADFLDQLEGANLLSEVTA